ncbi:hypothetical protein PUN28_006834 [Cardiocondyla obscurior]|uniref:Secreted protein n=1 Tax=Cardiocondyla obscurior TaxID=286306 RepID=A0AAW2FZW5_9HYME
MKVLRKKFFFFFLLSKTHCALKEIYYAMSSNAGDLFFRSLDSDESKISLTFPSFPRHDVRSYYLRYVIPARLDLVVCNECSFFKVLSSNLNKINLDIRKLLTNIEFFFFP